MNLYLPHDSWVEVERRLYRSVYVAGTFELTVHVFLHRHSYVQFQSGCTLRPWMLDFTKLPLGRDEARDIVCAPAERLFARYAEEISWLRCDWR